MLDRYEELSPMYKAELSSGELVVLEVSPHCYMRVGTKDLGRTKLEAIEILKKSVMERFLTDMKCIDWQSQQYVRSYHHD